MRGHERQPDARRRNYQYEGAITNMKAQLPIRRRNYLRAPVGEAARAVLLERRVDLFGDALMQHEPVHFGPTAQGGLLPRGHLLGGGRSACNQWQSACHPRQSACHRLGRYLWVQRRWRIAISANQHALTLWVGGRIAISANQHALTLWVGGRIANGGGESGSAIARWFSKHAAHGAI